MATQGQNINFALAIVSSEDLLQPSSAIVMNFFIYRNERPTLPKGEKAVLLGDLRGKKVKDDRRIPYLLPKKE